MERLGAGCVEFRGEEGAVGGVLVDIAWRWEREMERGGTRSVRLVRRIDCLIEGWIFGEGMGEMVVTGW